MPENVASLVGFRDENSVREAIDQCEGFASLKPGDKVLIKPNLVGWDAQGPFPPWGVLTTSRVVEGICMALTDAGAGDIRIAEGSVQCKTIGSSTAVIYKNLGYRKLTERYGAKLIDLNEEEHEKIEIAEGHEVKATSQARECDFLINVPVLKTHGQTIVSLGIKNLKGLLDSRSKMYCHHPDGLLNRFVSHLPSLFPPSLTIIDGVYALEQGPLHFGRAHRMNLLIASTDVYAADLVGANIIGYDVDHVEHLRLWAERSGRSKVFKEIDIRGNLEPEEIRKPLKWDWEWAPDNSGPNAFARRGIKGIFLPKYDDTLCTGCSYMYNPLMLMLLSSEKKEFERCEFLSGKRMEPSGRAQKTFLFGKCQCSKNKDHPACGEVIEIKGCPPSLERMEQILRQNGIPVDRKAYDQYRSHVMNRYLKDPETFPLRDFYLDEIP